MELNWKEIEAIGVRLGAGKAAVKQWKYRGIPFRWQLPVSKEIGVSVEKLYDMRQQ